MRRLTVLTLILFMLSGCQFRINDLDGDDVEIEVEMFGSPTEFQRWNENSLKLM